MSALPYPVVSERVPIDQVEPERVSTGEVLLRVMQEDTRSVQHLFGGTFGEKSASSGLFSPSAMIGMLALGPVLLTLHKTVMMFKDLVDPALSEMDEEGEAAKADGHTEEKMAEEEETFSVKKMWDDLVSKVGGGPSDEGPSEGGTATPIQAKPPSSPAPTASTYTGKTAKPSPEIDKVMRKVGGKHGVDYETIYAFSGSESSFRSGAKAKTSTAEGMLQFTSGTWKYLSEGPFKRLGYKPADRSDPEKSATMASLYIDSIRTSLRKSLGHEPSLGEIYTGYVMGPTGGARFLKAMHSNSKQIGAELFPREAKANRNLFYNGSTPLTLAETFGKLSGKVNAYYADAKAGTATQVATSGKITSDESHLAPQVPTQSRTSQAPKVATAKGTASPVKLTLSDTQSKVKEEVSEVDTDGDIASDQPTQMAQESSGPKKTSSNYVRDRAGRLISIPG